MSKYKKKTSPLFVTGIPLNVKLLFKAKCYRRGKSIKKVIIELMKEYAKKG